MTVTCWNNTQRGRMGRAPRNPSFPSLRPIDQFRRRPCGWINPLLDIPMERGIRSVNGSLHITMLHGIIVHILQMAGQILRVANGMFPIPPLPETAFVFSYPASGNPLAGFDASGKGRFDLPPAQAKVAIPFGQGPQGMKMVGQDDHGVEGKRVGLSDLPKCLP
jgi:hypothetical protein